MKLSTAVLICLGLCASLYVFLNARSNWTNLHLKVHGRFIGVLRPKTLAKVEATEKETRTKVEVTKVVFLKTHKIGGSTLQNILFRKAYNANLTVALPRNSHIFRVDGHWDRFQRSMMAPLPPKREVNMILSHMIFNYKEVSAAMNSDAVYITMLREPGKRFESAFNFLYNRVPAFRRAKGKKSLFDYLEKAEEYYSGTAMQGDLWWQGKNGIFYEFGYDNNNESEEYVAKAIEEIDEIFDLILIVEYFDMSLLLLMDLLNWDMEDMVYLVVNARKKSLVSTIDLHTQNLIYDWNKADVALYKHFNETFWRSVENYGRKKMENNLKRFQQMKEEAEIFCVERVTNANMKRFQSSKMILVVEEYKLKTSAKQNLTCVGMTTKEGAWHSRMRKLQQATPT